MTTFIVSWFISGFVAALLVRNIKGKITIGNLLFLTIWGYFSILAWIIHGIVGSRILDKEI